MPKCAFVYSMLHPFLEQETLIKIFWEDLYSDKSLKELFEGNSTYRQEVIADAYEHCLLKKVKSIHIRHMKDIFWLSSRTVIFTKVQNRIFLTIRLYIKKVNCNNIIILKTWAQME